MDTNIANLFKFLSDKEGHPMPVAWKVFLNNTDEFIDISPEQLSDYVFNYLAERSDMTNADYCLHQVHYLGDSQGELYLSTNATEFLHALYQKPAKEIYDSSRRLLRDRLGMHPSHIAEPIVKFVQEITDYTKVGDNYVYKAHPKPRASAGISPERQKVIQQFINKYQVSLDQATIICAIEVHMQHLKLDEVFNIYFDEYEDHDTQSSETIVKALKANNVDPSNIPPILNGADITQLPITKTIIEATTEALKNFLHLPK